MAENYQTFDGKRHSFTFKINQLENGTFMASVVHAKDRAPPDDLGALYYVVAVLLIYGCSILLMLGSYVRKNKMDQKMNRYHKEMINVRKRERQIQLCNAAKKAAAADAKLEFETQLGGGGALDKKLSNISETSGGDSMDGGIRSNTTEDDDDEEEADKLEREKMYLDLPMGSYTNTDSDNDTSTEGEACYLPAITKPTKSILKSASKSVTLMVPSPGDVLTKQGWSFDSDSCNSGEQSPNLDIKQEKPYDVSFV